MEIDLKSLSSDSISKDLLLQIQQRKQCYSPPCRSSHSNSESSVDKLSCDVDGSPGSPKSVISDEVFFRSTRNDEDARSRASDSTLHVPRSPGPERLFGENSDWMLAERAKARSPPVSPCLSVRHGGNFRYSPVPQILERQPTRSQSTNDLLLRPSPYKIDERLERTGASPYKIDERHEKTVACDRTERSPLKCHSPVNFYDPGTLRTPTRDPTYTEECFLRGSGSRRKEMLETKSAQYFHGRIPDSPRPTEYMRGFPNEDFERYSSARKQLSFEPSYAKGYERVPTSNLYPPHPSKRYRANSDSDLHSAADDSDDEDSRLIAKFLSHMKQRKRKCNDRFDDDRFDDELETKRKRIELEKKKKSLEYLDKLKNDVRMLNCKLSQDKPELRMPIGLTSSGSRDSPCSCAVMEKQFHKMAENAYSNIRRHDTSADGFSQFIRELSDTNEILRESMTVLTSIKECCEHHRSFT